MKLSRTTLTLAGVLALAACSDSEGVTGIRAPEAAPLLSAGVNAIEGDYMVVLKEGANANSVAAIVGVTPSHVYTTALNGFSASLNQGQLNALLHNQNVAYVEEDAVAEAATTQSGATWGIDRIDQRARPLSGTYNYTNTGSSVYAYIIDTGIYTAHSNFGGRAAVAYDALGGNGQDCNGHGTHVAGTVGSSTYGVAKGVRLRAVRVLDCSGSGSISGIIAGVDWVRLNRTNPAVANLSLGGGNSASLNTAVTNLANSGVFVAVAAGNENQNACNVSPANASAVTTVAASTSTDARASYSNYGSCVDLYAPGSSITSTWSNGGTNSISGTSMASPHVAGVAALYKGVYGNASQATIDAWLKNNATLNVITGNPTGTPNRLLFKSTL
ncbi:S8 family peptidase [Longimicrobium terrae]|uniref:Subtilisin family serine protease n=1 Tax=Longimicrobium terrae TaxID=1639882 RepID=A0A841GXN5_9BACT|nr:S8 family peptidase [Longimicrobium terrae]MBB4636108.1 subtilisin family serine protease [Longimicrobium terrae]MBB6070503.1 subtilisin family serine protease [Longimicrobium terrae]NNC29493.1 S8 family peptidase [Longimicrobium terrae]